MQDESCVAVSDAYKEARGVLRSSGGTSLGGIAQESIYQKKVEQALTDENCFKVITVSLTKHSSLATLYIAFGPKCANNASPFISFFPQQHNKSMQLSIELLDTGSDTNSGQEEAAETEKWTKYVDNFIGDGDPGGGGGVGGDAAKPKEEPSSNAIASSSAAAAAAGGVIDPLASSEATLLTLIGSGGINGDVSDELKGHLKKKPVFLSRNIRKWRLRVKRRPDGGGGGGGVVVDSDDRSKEGKDKKSDGVLDRLTSMSSSTTMTKVTSATAMQMTTTTTMSTSTTTPLSTTPATTTSSTSSSSNPPSRINLSDLTVTDDIECKFTLGNFKMLYVVNSESYLYKHSSLLKAKKVSRIGEI